MPRIDPERHKAARRSNLPRTPGNTAGILVPDLPPQFRKSSQRTLATHSTSGSEQEEEEDDDEEEELSRQPSFFIPGITAKARCLTTPPPLASAASGDAADAPIRNVAANPSPSKTAATASTKTTTTTATTTATAALRRPSEATSKSVASNHSAHSQTTDKSRDSYLSSHSRRSNASTTCSPEELQEAMHLYDSVVSSIQCRRETEVDEVLLDEMDYQRMLQELQPVPVVNGVHEEHSLREQVESIRDLLNDYYDRKNKQSGSSRSAMDYLEALALGESSGDDIAAGDGKRRRSKNNGNKSRLDYSYNNSSIDTASFAPIDGSIGSGCSSREDDEGGDDPDQNRAPRRKSVNKLAASDSSKPRIFRTSGGCRRREDDDEGEDGNKHTFSRSGIGLLESMPKPSPRSHVIGIGIGGAYGTREEDDEEDGHRGMRRKGVYRLGLTDAKSQSSADSSSGLGYSSREEEEEEEAVVRNKLDQLGSSEGKSKSSSRNPKSSREVGSSKSPSKDLEEGRDKPKKERKEKSKSKLLSSAGRVD